MFASIFLDRPSKANAFDDQLIASLTQQIRAAAQDENIRGILLQGEGKHFSAGADIAWMARTVHYSVDENLRDAQALSGLMQALDQCEKPTIAVAKGATVGGGLGLLACCDVVLAANDATFCLSEVKLGLIPAVIMPYLVRALGWRRAQALSLTAQPFSAAEACRWGLVSEVLEPAAMPARLDALQQTLAANKPNAMQQVKRLLRELYPITQAMSDQTAARIAEIRVGAEAQAGLTAFLAAREPPK